MADRSPEAFSKVVDRLLASPSYGERWGRHWLDVVRYADTAGETADFPVREAYRYRNYVIAAFNADKPYDQFVREQIAGDLYAMDAPPEHYEELVTATGFIAISRRFGFDPQNYQHLTIQDTIDTLGQSVLGLTLGCARCHNHKFDPVTSADYYALYGIFDSTALRVSRFRRVEASARFPSGCATIGRPTVEGRSSSAVGRDLRCKLKLPNGKPAPTPKPSASSPRGKPIWKRGSWSRFCMPSLRGNQKTRAFNFGASRPAWAPKFRVDFSRSSAANGFRSMKREAGGENWPRGSPARMPLPLQHA